MFPSNCIARVRFVWTCQEALKLQAQQQTQSRKTCCFSEWTWSAQDTKCCKVHSASSRTNVTMDQWQCACGSVKALTTRLSFIFMSPASSGSTTRNNHTTTPADARAAPGIRKAHPQPHDKQAAATAEPKIFPTDVCAFQMPAGRRCHTA